MSRFVEGYYITGVITEEEVQFSRNMSVVLSIISEIVLSLMTSFLTTRAINSSIVSKIHNINNDLSRIIEGDVDVKLSEASTEEFKKLSDDINVTVSTIKEYAEKGIPAAMLIMTCKTMFKDLVGSGVALDEAFSRVNSVLESSNEEKVFFVTVWMGVLDLNSGHVKYVNAHRNEPIREILLGIKEDVDAHTGTAEQVDDVTMLGLCWNGGKKSDVT